MISRASSGLLLDTHALIWWLADDERLGGSARRAISDASYPVFVSAVSAFEMATKHRLGKWPEVGVPLVNFDVILAKERFQLTPILASHDLVAGQIPGDHRDPFDRLLAAQSKLEGLTLVTTDAAFETFGIACLW